MPAYLLAQIRILHPEPWAAYRAAVVPLAQRFGGRQLVRGAPNITVLEGAHDGRSLVVFEFPSMQAIEEFWASPEYVELKTMREGAADLDAWAVPGIED